MPKAIRVKVKKTGNIQIITPRAYQLNQKAFMFIENVTVDSEGNEIKPTQAPVKQESSTTVSEEQTDPNFQTQDADAKGAGPVVSKGGRPRKNQTPQ
jgi:hypothetical protein